MNKNQENDFKVEIEKPEFIKAGLAKGEKVGNIAILKNGEVVKNIDLIVKEKIEKMTFKDSVGKILNEW